MAAAAPPVKLQSLRITEKVNISQHLQAISKIFNTMSKMEATAHLFLCWSVNDVIHRGRRAEDGDVSTFKKLDPVMERALVQTGHDDGVYQFP